MVRFCFGRNDGRTLCRAGTVGSLGSASSLEHYIDLCRAARVGQGSALIYGRKVEYLHALVLQALEVLSSQQADKARKAASQQQTDKDVAEDEAEFHDAALEFLPLDDIIKEVLPALPHPPQVVCVFECIRA